jgi:glyoxylase-like metal-dependent hydrolase (beta-lactamase superfamily II)
MTGAGNWTYLLAGEIPVLIDAGVGKPAHVGAIAAKVPVGPAHVIVTHAHDDHASGVNVLAQCWPRTRFWKFPWPERDAKYGVGWNYLVDTQTFPAGDDELQVVHTPGHAPDHVCLWHASTKTLFGGDLLVLGSTVVIPASTGGSLADYLASLDRVDALGAARVLPAHGEPVDDPHTVIRAYIDHRRERERQVLAALDEGRTTVSAITDAIYVGLAPPIYLMARESVLAHLVKLESEGAVYRHGDHWVRHP